MNHKPFNLYKRPTTKKGKYVYYVRFYDDFGKRLPGKSTGQTSKSAAEAWAIEQLHQGQIIIKKNVTFSQYAQDWWTWDKCKYINGKIARGSRISRDYTDGMKTYLERHILTYFGNTRIQRITADQVEDWLLGLRDKPSKAGSPLLP